MNLCPASIVWGSFSVALITCGAPFRASADAASSEPCPPGPESNHAVSIAKRVFPEYPDAARATGAGGVARVLVHVDRSGAVSRLELERTTGNDALDAEALRADGLTTFEPSTVDCTPVPDVILLTSVFARADVRNVNPIP